MDYNAFIQLIKLYERPPQLLAYSQPMRSALHRTPEALANLLHSIMPVLQAQFNNLCPSKSAYLAIFGFQPAVLATPSLQNDKDELWYTLDFDVFEQAFSNIPPKLIKSDALFINVSTGLIVNGAYYSHLINASLNSLDAICYSQIPLPQLRQAWSAIFQSAQAETPDIICANLCRDFYYPWIPTIQPSVNQQNAPLSPSFWRKNSDSQLMKHRPSDANHSKSLEAISCQVGLSMHTYGKYSI